MQVSLYTQPTKVPEDASFNASVNKLYGKVVTWLKTTYCYLSDLLIQLFKKAQSHLANLYQKLHDLIFSKTVKTSPLLISYHFVEKREEGIETPQKVNKPDGEAATPSQDGDLPAVSTPVQTNVSAEIEPLLQPANLSANRAADETLGLPVASTPIHPNETEKEKTQAPQTSTPDLLELSCDNFLQANLSPISFSSTASTPSPSPCKTKKKTLTPQKAARSPVKSPFQTPSSCRSSPKRRPPKPTTPHPQTLDWVAYQLRLLRPKITKMDDGNFAELSIANIENSIRKGLSQEKIDELCQQVKRLQEYIKLFEFHFKPQFLEQPSYQIQIIDSLESKLKSLPDKHPLQQKLVENLKTIKDLITAIKNENSEEKKLELGKQLSRLYNECHIEYIKPVKEIEESEWAYNKSLADMLILKTFLLENQSILKTLDSDKFKKLINLLNQIEPLKEKSDKMIHIFADLAPQLYSSYTPTQKAAAIQRYANSIIPCETEILAKYKKCFEELNKLWPQRQLFKEKNDQADSFFEYLNDKLREKKLMNHVSNQTLQSDNLNSLLIVPIQRMTRYPILLEAVIKNFHLAVGCATEVDLDSELRLAKERIIGKKITLEAALNKLNNQSKPIFDFDFKKPFLSLKKL